MKRRSAATESPSDRTALVLSPEPPWPTIGGGALRTASLLEYLRGRYRVSVVVFRETGARAPEFPPDVAGYTIEIPRHSRSTAARVARNLGRLIRGVPPLVDRFSGFELPPEVRRQRFSLGIVEHFWCAPYADALRPICDRLVLNLHNIESVLHARQADKLPAFARLAFRRFAANCAALERTWLPKFDTVLVTSEDDRNRIGSGVVYPNAVPPVDRPVVEKHEEIAFSGNMEYEPNYTAVRWFATHVWPELRSRNPHLSWRLIGRNEGAVRPLVSTDPRVLLTGPVSDAIPELARARAAVVPVQAGSGTRIKIIEAWAAGVPVISTTIGAEGLPYAPGEHLLIANTPAEFVLAIERVLNDSALSASLASSGRRLYEQRLTWPTAWEALETVGM